MGHVKYKIVICHIVFRKIVTRDRCFKKIVKCQIRTPNKGPKIGYLDKPQPLIGAKLLFIAIGPMCIIPPSRQLLQRHLPLSARITDSKNQFQTC